MPPKVADLIAALRKAGFVERSGKGSHRNFKHPRLPSPVTLSGRAGGDALPYPIQAVSKALAEVTDESE